MRALFCLVAFTFVLSAFAQSAPCDVHDCTYASAIEGNTTIIFSSYFYAPACIRVALGTNVTFSGDFSGHPLVSGYYVSPTATPFNGSIENTSSGTTATFTMNVNGANPYYCEYHKDRKMYGVIYVGDSCASATPTAAPTSDAPTANTPITTSPTSSPVAPTSRTPSKTSAGFAVQVGVFSLLGVLAI